MDESILEQMVEEMTCLNDTIKSLQMSVQNYAQNLETFRAVISDTQRINNELRELLKEIKNPNGN